MKLELDFKLTKNNFSMEVDHRILWDKPSVHVLFGESGCGKSHLLRSICGLENIEGHLSYNETPWNTAKTTKHPGFSTPCHKRNVAMVFQDNQLFTHLNVKQNLLFSSKRSNATQDDFQLCVTELGIAHLLQSRIESLSGGEKQRVAIARCLLSKPDLLLMDEPLASLDWKSKLEILPFIQVIAQQWQLPILYVTHSIEEVMQLADHVFLLKKEDNVCKIDRSGPLTAILTDINNPFNQHHDACSLLTGTLKHEGFQQDGLVKVQLSEQSLYLTQSISQASNDPYSKVRLNIQAKDVSISLSHAMDSSILNILNGTILNIKQETNGHCLIQVEVDGQVLLSRISGYSMKRLNLKPSQSIFVQIKAVALAR